MGFDRAPREEHNVVCAECGVETTVPFKPTGDRPVLCRDCFRKGRPAGGRDSRGPPRRDGPRSSGPREMFDATCTRCGTATQVPFRPTPGRDVLCRTCFAK
jgi:CxxC-x17-CxxC domain-containing protein